VKGTARIESRASHVQHANNYAVKFDPLADFPVTHGVDLMNCPSDARSALQNQHIRVWTGESSHRANKRVGGWLLSRNLGHHLANIGQRIWVVALALPEDTPEGLPLFLNILFLFLLTASSSGGRENKRINHTKNFIIHIIIIAFLLGLVIK
jgi:hypothetical protein